MVGGRRRRKRGLGAEEKENEQKHQRSEGSLHYHQQSDLRRVELVFVLHYPHRNELTNGPSDHIGTSCDGGGGCSLK